MVSSSVGAMNIKKSDFQLFITEKARWYPYSEVRFTRRHFHVKWLLLAQCEKSFVMLPSRVLQKATATALIVGKEALPVPTMLNEIVDFMERWGRSDDQVWYKQVVNWIGYVCNEGIKRDYLGVAYDCVALKVRRVLHLRGIDGNTRVFTAWKTFFFHQYHHVTKEFVLLKQASMDFVAHMIGDGTPGSAAVVNSNAVVVSP
jgi:hypothetical protein